VIAQDRMHPGELFPPSRVSSHAILRWTRTGWCGFSTTAWQPARAAHPRKATNGLPLDGGYRAGSSRQRGAAQLHALAYNLAHLLALHACPRPWRLGSLWTQLTTEADQDGGPAAWRSRPRPSPSQLAEVAVTGPHGPGPSSLRSTASERLRHVP